MKDNNKMFNELNESIQAFVGTPKRRIEKILYEILTGEYGQFLLDEWCWWGQNITGENVCEVTLKLIDKNVIYCDVELDYYDYMRLEIPLKYLRNEKTLKKASDAYWRRKDGRN